MRNIRSNLAFLFLIISLFSINSCKKDDSSLPDNIIKDIDGNIYHTVTIGTQTWMVENLKTTKYNDGSHIPNVTDANEWETLATDAYSWYDNETKNKTLYGALYNWYAISTGKLCPKGWHVPSNEEYEALENYLLVNGYNYNGETIENEYALALTSDTGWEWCSLPGSVGNTDYPDKRNATGFAALPGGWRSYSGSFFEIGEGAFWWTSSENDSNSAWYRSIYYTHYFLYKHTYTKTCGFSVRCIKD